MTGTEIAGVLCVVQTPFHDDGAIDPDAFVHQVDWLFGHGVDGVVIGMVSEFLRLSSEERDQLATLLCTAADGRGAAVVSVGAESTHTAVRHARHAAAAGADAVMAAPPALHRAATRSCSATTPRSPPPRTSRSSCRTPAATWVLPMSIDLQARLQPSSATAFCSSRRHRRSGRS